LNLKTLKSDVKISPKKFMAVTLLTSGTLSWIFITYFAFEDIFLTIANNLVWAYAARALFMSLGALFALIGSSLTGRISRRKILLIWISLGVVATALLAIVEGVILGLLASVLLGASIGLGLPSCMAFLADCTRTEERARVAGAVILETFAIVTVSVLAYSILGLGVLWLIVLSLVIRSTSYLAIAMDSCDPQYSKKEKTASWQTVLARKDFVLYLIPWLMFNIASGLIAFVWKGLPEEYLTNFGIGSTVHFLGAGIFGFIAGITADRFGRKQLIVIGLIMLGVSFAFLGLFTSALSVLVYLTLSGIAWGFLIVVYTAVPGDLSFSGSKEKFYALGAVIPFTIYFAITGVADFLQLSIQASVLSSTLSIILFLSIIPILKAAETLPETKIRERKMKNYVEQVGKIIDESKKP
jgi:MFS family permease